MGMKGKDITPVMSDEDDSTTRNQSQSNLFPQESATESNAASLASPGASDKHHDYQD